MKTLRPVFDIQAADPGSKARAGILRTPHGEVETPVFMPVATQGSVKALTQEDLASLGARILLANAYHLSLRPGTATIERAGGLHRFMGYGGAILTDSGGFQVMSLEGLRELTEEGVTFKSHLDGSLHTLTPESVISIQHALGSDIWTALDECVRWPCSEAEARRALERTMRWTERAAAAYRALDTRSLFFPILQGSAYPDLRRRAAGHIAEIPHHGVCIGGVSVGEPKERSWETVARAVEFLPAGEPRYLMGVGAPGDLWDAVEQGVDMLDCVWPTRLARHGCAVTRGERLNLANAAFREDHGPLDPGCSCRVCKTHSRAYLAHLCRARELSLYPLLTYHNLHLLLETMRDIRAAILEGRFRENRPCQA